MSYICVIKKCHNVKKNMIAGNVCDRTKLLRQFFISSRILKKLNSSYVRNQTLGLFALQIVDLSPLQPLSGKLVKCGDL